MMQDEDNFYSLSSHSIFYVRNVTKSCCHASGFNYIQMKKNFNHFSRTQFQSIMQLLTNFHIVFQPDKYLRRFDLFPAAYQKENTQN